jgi:hypothetical protein
MILLQDCVCVCARVYKACPLHSYSYFVTIFNYMFLFVNTTANNLSPKLALHSKNIETRLGSNKFGTIFSGQRDISGDIFFDIIFPVMRRTKSVARWKRVTCTVHN